MYSNDQNHGKTGNVTVYAQVSRSKTDFLLSNYLEYIGTPIV